MSDAIVDILIGIPLFNGFTPADMKAVAEKCNIMEVEKGDIVFKEGDKGDYMCFVASGMLDVLKQSEAGKSAPITTLTRGRSIGEISLIDDYLRSATVRATKKSELITLTKANFESILENQPQVGIKLLKGITRILSLSLRKTSSQLADALLPMG